MGYFPGPTTLQSFTWVSVCIRGSTGEHSALQDGALWALHEYPCVAGPGDQGRSAAGRRPQFCIDLRPLPDPLHCTILHCTALHCTELHCTALHCTAQHFTAPLTWRGHQPLRPNLKPLRPNLKPLRPNPKPQYLFSNLNHKYLPYLIS